MADSYDLYLLWDDTVRLMLEQDADEEELEQMLDLLNEIVADNIDNGLEASIREVRKEYLEQRESSGVLDSISEAYDETILEMLNTPRQE